MLTGVENYESLKPEQRGQLRRIMLCISDTTDKVAKLPDVSADDQRLLKKLKTDMLSTISTRQSGLSWLSRWRWVSAP